MIFLSILGATVIQIIAALSSQSDDMNLNFHFQAYFEQTAMLSIDFPQINMQIKVSSTFQK